MNRKSALLKRWFIDSGLVDSESVQVWEIGGGFVSPGSLDKTFVLTVEPSIHLLLGALPIDKEARARAVLAMFLAHYEGETQVDYESVPLNNGTTNLSFYFDIKQLESSNTDGDGAQQIAICSEAVESDWLDYPWQKLTN